MKNTRRKLTDKFKAKVALEAIHGAKTLAQLASYHKVTPQQVSEWKKHMLENASSIFSKKPSSKVDPEKLTAPLFEEIGRLKMDIKWYEKKL